MIKSLEEKKGGIFRLEADSLAFTQIIDNLNLIDLEPINGFFSWNNKLGGMHQIGCRLDCFLITQHTLLEGWNIESSIIPTTNSDHWMINLSIDLQTLPNNRPFRFEKFWLKHPNFMNNIKEWWQESQIVSGIVMYRFQQHLKAIKAHLKYWLILLL